MGYQYSKQMMISQPLTESLELLLSFVNEHFHATFNGILVNEYINGENYIGAHSDNELCLSNIGVIAISIGAVRKFRIRNKKTKQIIMDIPTLPYQFIQMGGEFQKLFTHEIPVQKKIKDSRISFTFRHHLI